MAIVPTDHSTEDRIEAQDSMFDEGLGDEGEETFDDENETSYEFPQVSAGSVDADPEPELDHGNPTSKVHPAPLPERPKFTDAEAPVAGVLTADDFAALEDRILRAVSMVGWERELRAAAEGRAAALESQLHEAQAKSSVVEALQQEIAALRAEREQVRHRVDRLLSQLDALEL